MKREGKTLAQELAATAEYVLTNRANPAVYKRRAEIFRDNTALPKMRRAATEGNRLAYLTDLDPEIMDFLADLLRADGFKVEPKAGCVLNVSW